MRLLVLFAGAVIPSLTCDCRRLPVCRLLEEGTPVFIGEVIEGGVSSLRDDPWYADIRRVRFKVLESFRGLPSKTTIVDLEINPPFGMCSPIPYFPGRKYLVFPTALRGKLQDGNCFQGRDIETAPEDLQQVRGYFSGKIPANLFGRIGMSRSTWIDFLLPIPGVKVSTSQGRETYSALTDSDGRYELRLPAPGRYQVRADLLPYGSDSKNVFVPRPGCAVSDFGLNSDTSISGKVLGGTTRPVKDAEVGLLKLDRVPAPRESIIVAYARTDVADMSYRFTNIPLGRYLILFNPDGPRSGTRFDLPFERTYYPSGANRTTARTVEVNSPGTHLTGINLAVGKRVSFRQVTVRVRFPDGMPMTTAEVTCLGVPLEKGDFPWFEHAPVNRKTGLARFLAPANRNLEFEVVDRHGRDLKAAYRSKHKAGTSPIHQEFVVRP